MSHAGLGEHVLQAVLFFSSSFSFSPTLTCLITAVGPPSSLSAGKNGYGDAAEQEQEIGSTPQRGVAALCWNGKKQSLLSGPTADVAVAWLFFVFFLFFLRVAADELAKGAGDTAVSPSQVLNCRTETSKSGRSLRDLEPQSLLPFHAKKL